MSMPSPSALGGPLGAALAGADPAAALQLQQLAAPAADAASKAADLQSQAEAAAQAAQAQAAQAQQGVADARSQAAAADGAAGGAEAAAANATKDLGDQFSSATPTGLPAVPCACGDCIKKAVDPAVPAI